jgi:hypothetical protein
LKEIANRKADLKASGDYRLIERNKMRRMFLYGILCGVIMAAAVTFSVAIPANNDHWRAEIVKRGGGSWYFDKNGHLGWMWTAELLPASPARPAAIVVPQSRPKPDSSPERIDTNKL